MSTFSKIQFAAVAGLCIAFNMGRSIMLAAALYVLLLGPESAFSEEMGKSNARENCLERLPGIIVINSSARCMDSRGTRNGLARELQSAIIEAVPQQTSGDVHNSTASHPNAVRKAIERIERLNYNARQNYYGQNN